MSSSFISSSTVNGTGATYSVPVPANLLTADLILAYVLNTYGNALTVPSGWTSLFSYVADDGPSIDVLWKVFSGESAPYSFHYSGSTPASIALVAYRGASGIDTFGWGSNTNTAPGISTTAANDTLLSMFIYASSYLPHGIPTMTVPTGQSARLLYGTGLGPSGGSSQLLVADEVVTALGGTGGRTSLTSNGTETLNDNYAVSIALKSTTTTVTSFQTCAIHQY